MHANFCSLVVISLVVYNRQTDGHVQTQTGRMDRQRNWQTDIQAETSRQTDWQRHRQMDKQKQTDIQTTRTSTHTHTDA